MACLYWGLMLPPPSPPGCMCAFVCVLICVSVVGYLSLPLSSICSICSMGACQFCLLPCTAHFFMSLVVFFVWALAYLTCASGRDPNDGRTKAASASPILERVELKWTRNDGEFYEVDFRSNETKNMHGLTSEITPREFPTRVSCFPSAASRARRVFFLGGVGMRWCFLTVITVNVLFNVGIGIECWLGLVPGRGQG